MDKWEFKDNLTLCLIEHPFYEIDLERCNTNAQVLNWIIQVSKKTWATPEIVGELVKSLNRCLNLQKNLCSGGAETKKPFKSKDWILSREGREYRYLTNELF